MRLFSEAHVAHWVNPAWAHNQLCNCSRPPAPGAARHPTHMCTPTPAEIHKPWYHLCLFQNGLWLPRASCWGAAKHPLDFAAWTGQ
jgi:hypothetical protein